MQSYSYGWRSAVKAYSEIVIHVFVTLTLSGIEGTVSRPGVALTLAKMPTVPIGSRGGGIAQSV